jgi:hypothetical protein
MVVVGLVEERQHITEGGNLKCAYIIYGVSLIIFIRVLKEEELKSRSER